MRILAFIPADASRNLRQVAEELQISNLQHGQTEADVYTNSDARLQERTQVAEKLVT